MMICNNFIPKFLILIISLKVSLHAATLQIGSAHLNIEIADTESLRNQGLMYRSHLSDDEGMLFVYPDSAPRCFWMKNTLIPLSIGFFDSEKKLFQIEEMTPPKSNTGDLKKTLSSAPAKYALEVPKGWFKDHNIQLGMKFSLQNLSK